MHEWFGKSFRRAVTSGRPLWPRLWSLHYLYRCSGYDVGPPFVDTRVAVMAAAGRPRAPLQIAGNPQAFDFVGMSPTAGVVR